MSNNRDPDATIDLLPQPMRYSVGLGEQVTITFDDGTGRAFEQINGQPGAVPLGDQVQLITLNSPQRKSNPAVMLAFVATLPDGQRRIARFNTDAKTIEQLGFLLRSKYGAIA